MLNKAKPDYGWWAKVDSWSFEDAALLHDVDPCSCQLFGMSPTEIPLDFREAHKTCSLLKSIAWKEKYPFHTAKGLHPLAVVTEAIKKDLPLPQPLRELITQRFADENQYHEKTTSHPLRMIKGMSCRCRIFYANYLQGGNNRTWKVLMFSQAMAKRVIS